MRESNRQLYTNASLPVVTGVPPLLVSVVGDTVPDLEESAILVDTVGDVETLFSAVKLDLATREGPVLVRKTLLAWLDEDGVTVVGTGRGKTVVVVEIDGDVRLTTEGGSLSGNGDGCRKGDERDLKREHHSEEIRRSDEV